MGKSVSETVRSFFGSLLPKSRQQDLVAEHIIREHHRGRDLDDILKDAYVTNRVDADKVDRCLERPEVIKAIGEDLITQYRADQRVKR